MVMQKYFKELFFPLSLRRPRGASSEVVSVDEISAEASQRKKVCFYVKMQLYMYMSV